MPTPEAWASVWEQEWGRLVGFSVAWMKGNTYDGEDLASNAFEEMMALDEVPVNPQGWLRQHVKIGALRLKQARVKELRAQTTLATGTVTYGWIKGGMAAKLARAKHKTRPTLPLTPCVICGRLHKARKSRGRRAQTCGLPRCVSLLRERNRREKA